MCKKVAILGLGSRGDCQPFIALALELQKKGIRVRLYAPDEMKSICAPFFDNKIEPPADFFGLPHMQVQHALEHDPLMKEAVSKGNFLTFARAASAPKFLQMGIEDAKMFVHNIRSEFMPNHVVFNSVAAIYGATVASLLNVSSTHVTMQMTLGASSIEPALLLSPKAQRFMPPFMRKSVWHVLGFLIKHAPALTYIEEHWRKEQLGLPPLTGRQRVAMTQGRYPDGCAAIVARSPLLSPCALEHRIHGFQVHCHCPAA